MGESSLIPIRVEGISGKWPEPPEWFSYSSLQEGEACPRRWALTRGHYPDVWEGSGYPNRPSLAALSGDITHECLEQIVQALTEAGCASVCDERAVSALRDLGGFTGLVEAVSEQHLVRLAQNPRCADRLDEFRSSLSREKSKIRRNVQALLARTPLAASPPGTSTLGDRAATSDRLSSLSDSSFLPDGAYSELQLQAPSLRMSGRADLIVSTADEVHILDYKSGDESPSHQDQVRLYGLLWARSGRTGRAGNRATRLTVVYPNRDVDVAPLEDEDIDSLEAELLGRIEAHVEQLASPPPPARPSEEVCRFCSVKHLCDDYWTDREAAELAEGFNDLRIKVIERNGPRSWRVENSAGLSLILRSSDESLEFEPHRTLRVVGGVVTLPMDTDDDLIFSLVSSSETYVELRAID